MTWAFVCSSFCNFRYNLRRIDTYPILVFNSESGFVKKCGSVPYWTYLLGTIQHRTKTKIRKWQMLYCKSKQFLANYCLDGWHKLGLINIKIYLVLKLSRIMFVRALFPETPVPGQSSPKVRFHLIFACYVCYLAIFYIHDESFWILFLQKVHLNWKFLYSNAKAGPYFATSSKTK